MKKSILSSKKKIFGLLLSSLFIFSNSFAAEPAFDKGSNVIGLGLGVGVDYGNYYGAYTGKSVSPTFLFTYDHGFFPEVGPGTIGIGGVIAYKSSSYKNYYRNELKKYRNSSFIIGVRGTYHLTLLKDKNNKFDPYAGVTFGIRINDDNYYDDYYSTYGYYYSYNKTNPVAGVFIGAHYNFKPAFGVFAEVGYDISLLRAGINFNF
ncbi:MAG TPA: hypothetical protein PKJ62_00100 [Bacteroidia bacterium]|nr:hypothetical protein [Bacteroidia bacterium]HNS12288.1 hypothetical protein [Bacteroidia bacterium]